MSTKYLIDTNAGPILRREFDSIDNAKAFVEDHVPLLRKRGYSKEWTRSTVWHVLNVFNSKCQLVHACAFRPVKKGER